MKWLRSMIYVVLAAIIFTNYPGHSFIADASVELPSSADLADEVLRNRTSNLLTNPLASRVKPYRPIYLQRTSFEPVEVVVVTANPLETTLDKPESQSTEFVSNALSTTLVKYSFESSAGTHTTRGAGTSDIVLSIPGGDRFVSSTESGEAQIGMSASLHSTFQQETAAEIHNIKLPALENSSSLLAPHINKSVLQHIRRVDSPASDTHSTPAKVNNQSMVATSVPCPRNMVFWSAQRQCVVVGEQGLCAAGRVIFSNSSTGEVFCQCVDRHLPWRDGACYRRFSQGPCGTGGVICETESGGVECRCRGGYDRGRDGTCYQQYTQADCPANARLIHEQCVDKGPCPDSFFMVLDMQKDRLVCGCPSGFLLVASVNRCVRVRTSCRHCVENLYQWPLDAKYYQEHTRGPCNSSDLLLYTTEGRLYCGCGKFSEDHLLGGFMETTTRWPASGRCYRMFERGPCELGEWIVWKDPVSRTPVCCPKSYFYWPVDGRCYEEFTKGPCPVRQLFVSILRDSVCTCDDQWGFTMLNAQDGVCYLRNSQGPCKPGLRYVSQRNGSPVCDCKEQEFYHEHTDSCYPLYRRGPCDSGDWFVYDSSIGRATCRSSECPAEELTQTTARVPSSRLFNVPVQRPLVYWKLNDRCYELGSEGPCGDFYRLELDEDGIQPICTPSVLADRDEPIRAPISESSRCPIGSYRFLHRLCHPTLGTHSPRSAQHTSSACGQNRVWVNEVQSCQSAIDVNPVACPGSYYPYKENGVCVCPSGEFPDVQGECRPSEHPGTGPLHWTIYNYRRQLLVY